MPRTKILRTALAATAAIAALAVPAGALAEMPGTGPQGNVPNDPAIRFVEKPVRTLQPMADEYVPAYTCPASHPYLVDERMDNGSITSALRGIIITRSSPALDVSITGPASVPHPTMPGKELLSGIDAGFPNSSAMNWSFYENSYRLTLKCTSDPARGMDVTNIGFIVG